MTIFLNGKQKRVSRPELIDGLTPDEFIARNADPIWLHQNGLWETMPCETEGVEWAMEIQECPFCDLHPERVLDENELAAAIADAFPVSPGHTLVMPKRHVADFFDLDDAEVAAVMELLFQMRRQVGEEYQPAGFNVGVNVGRAAGQTVMHAHVHLIPRYAGDVADPMGGVRGVVPGSARY